MPMAQAAVYRLTDAERGLATLLRDRRIRREPGTPRIPESQRHAVNSTRFK
ncbi:hypothetical protein [Kribbella sp. CA-294648]|uniref:hypothetical protein n=1 Tax=Kribbella sp. CA-294648 TaxID=3239948 RepID=UPI003D8DDE8E